MRNFVFGMFCIFLFPINAIASCNIGFSNFVGWTIVYSGTVTGYIDDEGVAQIDYEGCEWDRVLIIDYNKSVTCVSYHYSYSWHPEITLFARGDQMKACVNDYVFKVR